MTTEKGLVVANTCLRPGMAPVGGKESGSIGVPPVCGGGQECKIGSLPSLL